MDRIALAILALVAVTAVGHCQLKSETRPSAVRVCAVTQIWREQGGRLVREVVCEPTEAR